MNKKIQTYEDLQEEKRRLENLLMLHKQEMHDSWQGVKSSLNPINNVASFVGKLTRSDKSNPLLTMGLGFAGDLILRKFFKASLIARLVVPFVVKNYSSHLFSGKGGGIVNKLKNLFTKKRQHHNGTPDLTTSDWEKY